MFCTVTNNALQDWTMYGSGLPFLAKTAWSRDQDRSCPVLSQKHCRVSSFPTRPLPVARRRLPATCLRLLLPCLSLVSPSSKLITADIHRSPKAHYPSPVILLILFYLYSCLSFLIFSQPALAISSQPLLVSSCRTCCLFRSVEHCLGRSHHTQHL